MAVSQFFTLSANSTLADKCKSNTFFQLDAIKSRLAAYGRADGAGEQARVDFVQDASEAFAIGALPGKDASQASHFAWTEYNNARDTKLASVSNGRTAADGTVLRNSGPKLEVKESRKSELASCFNASLIHDTIVAEARAAVIEANAKLAGEVEGDKTPKKIRTYDAVISIARLQNDNAKEAKKLGQKATPLTRAEMVEALTTTKDKEAKPELDRLAKVIKELNSMKEAFPDNADFYDVALEGMNTISASITVRHDEKVAQAKAADIAARKAALAA